MSMDYTAFPSDYDRPAEVRPAPNMRRRLLVAALPVNGTRGFPDYNAFVRNNTGNTQSMIVIEHEPAKVGFLQKIRGLFDV